MSRLLYLGNFIGEADLDVKFFHMLDTLKGGLNILLVVELIKYTFSHAVDNA